MTSKPERLTALEPFWGVWYLDGLIGEGSYGKVFTIHRKDMGETYHAAMKWISLPKTQSELDEYRMEGMSNEELRKLYRETVNQLREEIVLMNRLRGNSHIVSYDDHLILERTEEIGWEILIRMELLTPLTKHFEKGMTVEDVIKMGLDICDGLTLCGKVNVIHRDIKPDNIFLSDFGEYKLGDFGVARRMEQTMTHMSRQGTPVYMAPEVYLNKGNYDATVDLYSLGMVMHRMLNRQRLPFLSMSDSVPTHVERNMAMETRMKGVPIPPPVDGGIALAKVICKACSFQAQKRYQSAEEMHNALLDAAKTTDQKQRLTNNPTGSGLNSGRSSLNPSGANWFAPSDPKTEAKKPKRQKKALWFAGLVGFCAIMLIGLGVWMSSQGIRDVKDLFTRPGGTSSVALKTMQSSEWGETATPRADIIEFPNAQVEATVRKTCGQTSGALYPEDVASVTSLNLNSMGITDLSFLKSFASLRGLRLSENAITDIAPLADLRQLMFLYLDNNRIADLSPLQYLRNLTNLSVENNPVTDLSALNRLSALQSLNASQTTVSDLEPLEGLSNLKSLYIEDTLLTAEQIAVYKNRMQGTAIIDNAPPFVTTAPAGTIRFLNSKVEDAVRMACHKLTGALTPEDMQAAIELSLPAMEIEDLDFLKAFTSLRDLNLSGNNIRDISALTGLNKLVSLNLKGNQIVDLLPIQAMENLINLNLTDNPVANLNALSSLTSLQLLDASGTLITSLSPLIGLPSLKSLLVYNTPLSEEEIADFKTKMPDTKVFYPSNMSATSTPAPTEALPAETKPDAESDTSTQHLNYQTIEGGIVITGVDDTVERLVIPDEIDHLPVVCIDDFAFIGNTQLVSVRLPRFLEEIGQNAFSECHNLTDIHFPVSLKSIGSYAFSFCFNLTNAQLPPLLKTVQNNTFIGCFHLINVELPPALETIEAGAFSGTGIVNVTIPDSVSSIGPDSISLVDEKTIRYKEAPDGTVLVGGFSSTYHGITFRLRKGSYAETYAREYGYDISYVE